MIIQGWGRSVVSLRFTPQRLNRCAPVTVTQSSDHAALQYKYLSPDRKCPGPGLRS